MGMGGGWGRGGGGGGGKRQISVTKLLFAEHTRRRL